MRLNMESVLFLCSTALSNEAIDAAATDFHRRFHISSDESESRGNQHGDVDTPDASQVTDTTHNGSLASSPRAIVESSPVSVSTLSNRSDAGLPTGWSMQIAPNGRMFFIDHNERKTSWVDPRTGRASPMPSQPRPPEDDLDPLPEGWEERVHSDGRIFFIDHSAYQ